MRHPPAALVALLVAAALLSAAWALVLPPLQGPDESAHIAATTYLVERGTLSSEPGLPAELRVLADQRALGPLIGNLAARPDWSAQATARTNAALRALGDRRADPDNRPGGPPTRGSARNPLYSAWTALPYAAARGAPLVDRLALMRLFNIPLLLVAIVASWLLAAELLPASGLARVLAAGVVALQPQLAFMSGVVNPDVLLVALSSVFCLLAARLLTRGLTLRRAAVLTAVAVAATATHSRGAVLLPCTLLAIGLAVPWSTLSDTTWRRIRRTVPLLVVAVLGIGAAVIAIGLPSVSPYAGRSASVREFASYLWQFYLPRLPFMNAPIGGQYGLSQVLETMWGAFGSLEIRYAAWVYDVVDAALALTAAGVVVAIVRQRPAVVAPRRAAVLFGGVIVLTLLSLHLVAYRLLRVDPTDPIIVGRHWLVLMAPLSLAVAVAVAGLPRRAAYACAAFVLGALMTLDLAALGLTVARFYG